MNEEPEPHHHHIDQTRAMFRACGFTLEAMQYRRPPEAVEALKRFNRVPEGYPVPYPWDYFPNAYMRDHWQEYYSCSRPSPDAST